MNNLKLFQIGESGESLSATVLATSQVPEVVNMTRQLYQRCGFVLPWIGYLAVREGQCVGTCGFTGPPQAGQVEIAYFTFPDFEGCGIATQMARKLLEVAQTEGQQCPQLIAHTLPTENASTSILRKLGFDLIGEIEHPEDGKVWKWSLADSGT